ncbi:MAG: SDR family NAD(P)-dependent oxidoreductase, partial [Acidobacteriota bacterium]
MQEPVERPVVFAFPGQGAQYPGMCRELYEQEASFKRVVDECAALLEPHLGLDLREVLYQEGSSLESVRSSQFAVRSDSESDPRYPEPGTRTPSRLRTANRELRTDLTQTWLAQPALFVTEYALARLWMEWGVQPSGMIGHSIGEFVAACLAGTLSLEDALSLVAQRGRLMQQMPAGSMLAADLSHEELEPLLPEGASIAAVNSPRLCVASGPSEKIEELASALSGQGVEHRRLHTSHAFHSAMMEPVLEPFRKAVRAVRLRGPEMRWVSNVTGRWIRPEQATDPDYWVEQLRSPVQFSRGLEQLLEDPQAVLLEVGPGNVAGSLARRNPAAQGNRLVLASSRHPENSASDSQLLLTALGQLWLAGAEVDWDGFHSGFQRRRLPLPTYPFQRQRYWIDPRPGTAVPTLPEGRAGKKENLAEWIHVPVWKQSAPLIEPEPKTSQEPQRWLVLSDAAGWADRVASHLEERGLEVFTVSEGPGFGRLGERAFEIDIRQPGDYEKLLSELRQAGQAPQGIAHFWSLTPEGEALTLEEAADLGFYSLLYLAQALGRVSFQPPVRVVVFSNGSQRVDSRDRLQPEKALIQGPCLVMPLEYPGLSCRSIDVAWPAGGDRQVERAFSLWAREILSGREEPVVAYRGLDRWVRDFEAMPLPEAGDDLPGLRPKGLYLITGGFGGLGFEVARELARRVKARLVLVGRPTAEEGKQRRRELRVRGLEKLGAEVLTAQADVCDAEQVRSLMQEVHERFGPGSLNGVIHAAGVAGGGAMQLKDRQAVDSVLAPKVRGTLNLEAALEGETLDFLILFSSLTSVLGAPGQVDYCAANAFLDAFAQDRSSRRGSNVLALGWDAWQKVGMAARAAGLEQQDEAEAESQPAGHPLLDRFFQEDGLRRTYTTLLKPSRHWILSEHRLGGQPVVPGTAYLEMVRAAFEDFTGSAAMELKDVLFLGPLQIRDNESREVRTVIERQGQACRFAVKSRAADGGEESGQWQEHVAGSISPLHDPASPSQALEEVIEGCSLREERMGEEYRADLRSAGLGPRWDLLQKVYVGDGQVLGVLQLSEDFAQDLREFKLHPSILDTATGFAEQYLDLGDSFYLPLSYDRLRFYSPLEPTIYSHARFPSGGPGKETVSFDLDLLNPKGELLAQIEGFTVKRIPDVAELVRSYAQQEGASAPPSQGAGRADRAAAVALSDGILPSQGLDVLHRLLSHWAPPHVLVSTQGMPAALQEVRSLAESLLDGGPPAEASAEHPRPDLATPYLAPRNPTEEKIAALWQSVLGIGQVGVLDDFFELGGHSLLATQVVSRLRDAFQVEVSVGALFDASTVAELAALVETEEPFAEGTETAPIPRAPGQEEMPLSYAQQRLWFLDQFEPDNPVYNICHAIRLSGDLQVAALQASLGEIVSRHETLRTSIRTVEGRPSQSISSGAGFRLHHVDLSDLAPEKKRSLTIRLVRQEANQPFLLSQGPLLRVSLLHLEENEHVVLVSMHHIISDGWSMTIFIRELWTLYEAFCKGRPSLLAPLSIQYADFAVWQRKRLSGEALQAELDYWKQRLSGSPSVAELPGDRPRPSVQTLRGGRHPIRIQPELTERLSSLSRQRNATLFMTLLSALATLLHRFSGQADLLLGTPIAGRNRSEQESLIGFFVNMLVLRVEAGGDPSFGDLLERVRESTLQAYAHSEVPFEKLVMELSPQRDLSGTPLFRVMIVLETALPQLDKLTGLDYEFLETDSEATQFDLTLDLVESGQEVSGWLVYNRDLFDHSTIQRVAGHFEALLRSIAEAPQCRLSQLSLLSGAQRHQLLCEWNDSASDRWDRLPQTLQGLTESQASRTPDSVAVSRQDRQLSYAELNAR